MHCAVCGKPISDPESVQRGIGPDCWEQLQREVAEKGLKFIDRYCGKFDGSVTLMRGTDGAPMTNIPHRIIKHSPSGYEWGFQGKGTNDLALNVLMQFTTADLAFVWYRDFAKEILSTLPKNGGKIKGETVKKWVKGKTQELF